MQSTKLDFLGNRMSFETIRLPAPELLTDPAVAKAAALYQRLVTDYTDATKTLTNLEAGRIEAAERDREAFAKALVAGKDDPGSANLTRHDKAITEARRRKDALALAADTAAGELKATIAERQGPWGADLKDRLDAARIAYLETVAELRERALTLRSAELVHGWIEKFPRPMTGSTNQAGVVPDLRGANGAAPSVEAVLAALEARARGAEQDIERNGATRS